MDTIMSSSDVTISLPMSSIYPSLEVGSKPQSLEEPFDGSMGVDPSVGDDWKEREKSAKADEQDYYFQYYASLQNQANMIGDTARTNAYRKAIMGNSIVAFAGKKVVDVGAGSGILSFFAAKAGATDVKAIEASAMAKRMQVILDAAQTLDPLDSPNPHLHASARKITILHGKVEDARIQREALSDGRVDTIISEPIGVMLFHERMVESFLLARDLFLKPSGSLFPSMGQLFFAPFSDEALYTETETRAAFFDQTLFGVDTRCLVELAREEAFAQPVVGLIPPYSLLADGIAPRTFDFYTMSIEDLLEFELDLDWVIPKTCLLNGVGSWFDLGFGPPPEQVPQEDELNAALKDEWDAAAAASSQAWAWAGGPENPMNPPDLPQAPFDGANVVLSTSPYVTRTHWQQCRLLLPEPLAVNRGERVTGTIRFTANESRSYDLVLDLYLDRTTISSTGAAERIHRQGKYNLAQQHFNYSYTGEAPVLSGYQA